MLIVGTVLSLASAAGPPALARFGLVPALGAALGSCWLAWREIAMERRAHAAAMLAASRRHGAQLSEERRHTTAVLSAMRGRVEAVSTVAASRAATIHRLGAEIARLSGDVNGLRCANGRLTRDLNFRDATIAELRETLERRQSELAVLLAADEPWGGHAAQGLDDQDTMDEDDLGDHAAVMDDDGAQRRTVQFLQSQLVTMPNYEGDRRPA